MDSRCTFWARNGHLRTAMDELDRAVGSNPTSYIKPLNRLQASIQRFSLLCLSVTVTAERGKYRVFPSIISQGIVESRPVG